jgi:hypothetical protein
VTYTLPSNISTTIKSVTFSPNAQNTFKVALKSGQGAADVKRLCGQPSNPQIFSDVQPKIYDVCVLGGKWARKDIECNIAGNVVGESSESSSFVVHNPDNRLLTKQTNTFNVANDEVILIYGKHFVTSNNLDKVKITLYQDDETRSTIECMVNTGSVQTAVYGLDQEGNCNQGCTVLCHPREGHGDKWKLRVKRGALQSAETNFVVSFKRPEVTTMLAGQGSLEGEYKATQSH